MAKYDVFGDPRGTDNLLIVVQDDTFESFDTRVEIQ